jgi:hypothetical protein
MDDWIENTKQQWLLNADPIMDICKKEYRWSPHGSLRIADVRAHVSECLREEGIIEPKDLQADITQALASMRITRNSSRHDPQYQNIEAIDPIEDPVEAILKKPMGPLDQFNKEGI